MAAAFEEALGKKVTYNRVSYEEAEKNLFSAGVEEWQVNALLAVYRLIDEGDPAINPTYIGDYQKITGEQPTNLKAWVAQVKDAFK